MPFSERVSFYSYGFRGCPFLPPSVLRHSIRADPSFLQKPIPELFMLYCLSYNSIENEELRQFYAFHHAELLFITGFWVTKR